VTSKEITVSLMFSRLETNRSNLMKLFRLDECATLEIIVARNNRNRVGISSLDFADIGVTFERHYSSQDFDVFVH